MVTDQIAVFVFILQAVYSSSLPAPQYLQVNYINTHEEYDLSDRRHLAMVEITSGHDQFKPPILSWKLFGDHSIFNDEQKYYKIQIFHEHDLTDNNQRELIFESDKIASKHPFCEIKDILTENLKQDLLSFKWKVLSFRIKWYNSLLQSSPWSRHGRFILTSGSTDDWNNASYIYQKTSSQFNERIPVFRNSFSTTSGKTVKSATVSIVGLGFFHLEINEQDVLQSVSPPLHTIPGWTNTEKRVPYITFDVTSIINTTTTNRIGVLLGVGYRNTSAYAPKDGRSKSDSVDCVLKFQLIITYTDNTQQIIISDNKWETTMSAIVISSIYNGETFNENLLPNSNTQWDPVMVMTNGQGPPGILYTSVQPYVSIISTSKPVNIYKSSDRGSQIIDFGKNTAGLVRINVAGLKAGTNIQMKFAEVKQHPNYGPANGDLYYGNLRSALQFDEFNASKNAENASEFTWYQPLFTIHGFQFVEIWNYPKTITTNDIIKLEIHSDLKMRSSWNCSDKILNNVNARCVLGQLSNLQSVPTDCNQRDERLGWMGDASLSSQSFAINFDMSSFISNYLILMQDEIGNDGSLPDVVPFYRYGGRPSDPNWGMAFPQNVWSLNKYYNMTSIVQQYMSDESIPKYIRNLQSRMPKQNGKDNISKYPASYGDWCPPPPAPKISNNFAGAFGYIETVRMVADLCNITGNTTYQNELNVLYSTLVSEFITAFYDSSKGHYLNGIQTSYAMALEAKIYSDSNMKQTLQKNLLSQIKNDKNLLTTGIIGAKFLLPALAAMNNQTLALRLIKGGQGFDGQVNASYPSWAYEGENSLEPATASVWELWNGPSEGPGMDSRNHHMFSSVSAYLNNYVSGLQQIQYNKWNILIGHLSYDVLQWSNIKIYDGMIEYNWKWHNYHTLDIHIIVPIGHTMKLLFNHKLIHVPIGYGCKWSLMEVNNNDSDMVWLIENIDKEVTFIEKYKAIVDNDGHVVIGSGKYEWQAFCLLTL